MTIRIQYYASSRVSDPVFGIALYSEDNHYLYGTNTELKEMTIGHVEGEGYIDLKIDRITMLSGKFFLTVAVHAHDGKPYDWIDKQYSFDVMPTGKGCRDLRGSLQMGDMREKWRSWRNPKSGMKR